MDSDRASDDFELVESGEVAKLMVAVEKPDIKKIKTWLKPTEYLASSSEFKRHASSKALDTGEWIRKTPQFDQWHASGNHGSIWIKAVPGAGKSVLAASMVDSLSRKESVPVLFFFFRQIIESNRTCRALLRDWLCQLIHDSEIIQIALWKHVQEQESLEDVSTPQLWHYLLTALRDLPRVYCIVDALDEMNTDEEFLSQLNSLGSFRPANVKILMTSRPKQYLQKALKDPRVIHVSLEEELVKRDISIFVQQRAKELGNACLDREMQRFIKDTVCERSQGLFLYARLMLDQIAQSLSDASHEDQSLRDMVAKLPVGLEEMYNCMLRDYVELAEIHQEVQILILELVTQAARPLRLIEIAKAIETNPYISKENRDSKEIVRSACGPLLEIMEDEVVQILHHSFTEFLFDNGRKDRGGPTTPQFPIIDPETAHRNIASTCLAQLQGGALDAYQIKRFSSSTEEYEIDHDRNFNMRAAFLQYPLLEYAVTKWAYHAKQYSINDHEFFQKLENFCEPQNPSFAAWFKYLAGIDAPFSTKMPSSITALHVAADHGLASWAGYLIAKGADIDSLDNSKRSPIFWAARKGHPEVVKLLLDAGAKPDLDDDDGHKPLHMAASRNHWKVARLLLGAGVSALTPKTKDTGRICGNSRSTVGDHPLMYASARGNLETVMEMVPYCKIEVLEDAIFLAAQGGHHALVGALLESTDISPNAIASDHRWSYGWSSFGSPTGLETLLMTATRSLEPKSVRILLQNGAHVNKSTPPTPNDPTLVSGRLSLYSGNCNPGGRTPLHSLAAVFGTHLKVAAAREILNMLLVAGAEIDARDSSGNTPLLLTLRSRDYEISPAILDLFLAAGSDPCAMATDGDTLLHQACEKLTSADVTATLLRYKANPNQARLESGITPLHLAVKNVNIPDEHLKLLVAHGGDVNIKDAKGNTPLHIFTQNQPSASTCVRNRALNALLSLGANVNSQNDLDETCLHTICISGYRSGEESTYVSTIVDAGINLELRNRQGMTVLLQAVMVGESLVEVLLKHKRKPDISARTWVGGKSVLHLACHSINPSKMIKLLVNHGADLNWVDSYGNTLLHEAASGFTGHPEDLLLVKYLIDNGVDINVRNSAQQCAFHIMPVNSTESQRWNWTIPRKTFVGFISQLDIKFDANAKDCDGYTPLHYASAFSEFQTFKLIECGSNLFAKAFNGRTPLHCAARGRRAGIVSMLLHYAGNGHEIGLNAKDSDGRTPLHDACRSGHPESVSILLAAGADFTKNNKNYRTPLEACAEAIEEEKIWAALDKQSCDRFKLEDPFRIAPAENDHNGKASIPSKKEFSNLRIHAIAKMLMAADKSDIDIQHSYKVALSARCPEMLAALKGEKCKESKVFEEARLMLSYYGASTALEQATGSGPLQNIMKELPGIDEPTMDALIAKDYDFTKGQANPESAEGTAIAMMTKLGLTELVCKIINKAKLFDDPEFIKPIAKLLLSGWKMVRPLLQIACDRPAWNMDMVRLLVEKGDVDVNGHHYLEDHSTTGNTILGNTALHIASRGRYWWQIEAIKYLIEKGADVNALNSRKETPLEIACASDSTGYFKLHCAEILLQNGADPNRVDSQGLTPLNRAKTDKEVIKILLKYGADVNRGTKSMLVSAAEAGDVEALKFYLEIGADCNKPDTSSILGTYPIMKAGTPVRGGAYSESDSAEMTRLLLDHGAKVDLLAPEKGGWRILHYLLAHATVTTLRPLLEDSRIDMNLRDEQGRTAFMTACYFGSESEDILETPRGNGESLNDDNSHPYLLLVNSPIHGSKIDYLATDNEGKHIIFYLISRLCDKKIPKRILDIPGVRGLIRKKDNEGYTPLHHALDLLRFSMVKQLVDEGADILEPDPKGNSMLHYLCTWGWVEDLIPLMNIYLDLGGSINARDNKGNTPFLEFIKHGGSPSESYSHLEGFPWFAERGTDFTAKNNMGQSALHLIAGRSSEKRYWCEGDEEKQKYNAQLFEALLEKGCEVLDEDNQGRTALDIAAVMGNKGILKLFERKRETGHTESSNSSDE